MKFLLSVGSFSALCRIGAVIALSACVVACGGSASVKGTIADAPESELVVKLLNVNQYNVLDTLTTGKDGAFSFKVDVKKGDPEFVYVFYGETRVASLLLERGSRISVVADTLGTYSVSGSEECAKFAEVEKDYADFTARFNEIAARLSEADSDSEQAAELRKELGGEYVSYYRDRLKYVISNPYSLTVVPVLLQNASPQLPVFAQETDAMHFSNACDSLQTVYPDSKYVKALIAETKKRVDALDMSMRIRNAEEVAYFDVELPDVNGQKKRLSEIDSDLILVFFWTSTDSKQKMYNQDVLKPVYQKYKSKGFEICQIAADVDKPSWARVVKDQELEWVNLCDGLGASSPVLSAYNITELPYAFFLRKGELVMGDFTDKASLERQIDKLLSK